MDFSRLPADIDRADKGEPLTGEGQEAGGGVSGIDLDRIVVPAADQDITAVGGDVEVARMGAGGRVADIVQEAAGAHLEDDDTVAAKAERSIQVFAVRREMDVRGTAGVHAVRLDDLLLGQVSVRIIKDGDVAGKLSDHVQVLACVVKEQVPGTVIRMQGGGAAVVPHSPGIDVQTADFIGTELTEEEMLAFRRKDCAMDMRRLLAGQVGATGARDEQGVQRGDTPVLPEPVGRKRTAGIIGDGKQSSIGGDVARVFAAERSRCPVGAGHDAGGLAVDKLEAIAAPTPGPDRGTGVGHLGDGIHLVAMDRQVRRVGHFRLRDGTFPDELSGPLVEIIGIEPVGVSAHEQRENIRAGTGGQDQGKKEKKLSHARSNRYCPYWFLRMGKATSWSFSRVIQPFR